jgi:HNH endonuclease
MLLQEDIWMANKRANRRMNTVETPLEHLMENCIVDIVAGCWNWSGSMFDNGYGKFKNKELNSGKPIPASRASWMILRCSDIGRWDFVCHKCDNRKCVNPDHLFLGSGSDNMSDCSQKRRINHGEDRPQSKLTEENVIEARQLRQQGMGWMRLAKRYGVHQNCVISAVTGKTWAHVTEPIPTYVGRPGVSTGPRAKEKPGGKAGIKNPAAKMTPDKVCEMRALRAQGETVEALAAKFGLSIPSAHKIVTLESWASVVSPHDDYLREHRYDLSKASHARKIRSGGPRVPKRGAENGSAKINEEIVREIRTLRAKGATYREIGEKFSVSDSLVAQIARRKLWSHIE